MKRGNTMNERNVKNYGLRISGYSARLDKIVTITKAIGMVELLDYINKAKYSKILVYEVKFPKGEFITLN